MPGPILIPYKDNALVTAKKLSLILQIDIEERKACGLEHVEEDLVPALRCSKEPGRSLLVRFPPSTLVELDMEPLRVLQAQLSHGGVSGVVGERKGVEEGHVAPVDNRNVKSLSA